MRILYITTIGTTMSFFKALIKELIEEGNTVDIATNDQLAPVAECYREWGCKVYSLSCTRSPFHLGTVKAIREIREILKSHDYDVVHCHTPVAAICARLASQPFRKGGLKVIYTAHGFHFYKGAPLKNWLMYYPAEKICSYLTDVLITINQEDYVLAKRKMKARRVEYVPGVGLDVQKFRDATVDRKEKRREIGVPEDAVLLVSVGELNKNKNHAVVIRALGMLKSERVHYAIAGRGQEQENLLKLAQDLGVADKVHLLGYRQDIAQLYKASDICVLPSIREGLGLAALEGMGVGLPLIVSDNRGTNDYAVHRENAFMCQYDAVSAFASAIRCLAEDTQLRTAMGSRNQEIVQRYDIEKINTRMKELYRSVGREA